MERSVSVSSDRNIAGSPLERAVHLFRALEYSNQNSPFRFWAKHGYFALIRESRTQECIRWKEPFLLPGWPGLMLENVVSFPSGTPRKSDRSVWPNGMHP